MTTKVTTKRQAVEEALKVLLLDKVGGDNLNSQAFSAAMEHGLYLALECDTDDLEEAARLASTYYDGYKAATERG